MKVENYLKNNLANVKVISYNSVIFFIRSKSEDRGYEI